MSDFAAARRMMVDGQVRPSDITDIRVITAMLDVPRERFVPASKTGLAYLDLVVAGEGGRGLLPPTLIAKLVHAAQVKDTDKVLDVGGGPGYTATILSHLAQEVVALEEHGVAPNAGETYGGLGRSNIEAVSGPLVEGWALGAPYDVIVLNGSVEVAPEKLMSQLADGGRLVCVYGAGPGSRAMLYRRSGQEVGGRPIFDAAAPVLPGFTKTPAFAF